MKVRLVGLAAGLAGLVVGGLSIAAGQAGNGDHRVMLPGLARDYDPAPSPTPTSTTVAVPTLTPTASPTSPPSASGTRGSPIPVGQAVTLGDGWTVTVISVTPDATALVLAENQFNDPPAAGHQFFIARVTATYGGAGQSQFDGSYRLRAVGTSSVARTTFFDSCGVIPDDLEDPDVFSGGSITGNICWAIPSSDANTMTMFDNPFLMDMGTTFLSLLAPGVAAPAVPGPPPSVPLPATGLTRESPVPIGVAVPFTGGWNVTVLSVTPDATALVLAENQFNDPPTAGHQFFIATITATHTGQSVARFDGSFRLRSVGVSSVGWSTFENSCGVIPDDLEDPDVFPSGTITGNVCWEVPIGDANGLVLYDDPFLADPTPRFLALH